VSIIKEIYPVEGISCTSCALRIQTMLSAQDGVRSAVVNLAMDQVVVEYEPQLIDPGKMEKVIDGIGIRENTEEKHKSVFIPITNNLLYLKMITTTC
jgi:cation transport ATPase